MATVRVAGDRWCLRTGLLLLGLLAGEARAQTVALGSADALRMSTPDGRGVEHWQKLFGALTEMHHTLTISPAAFAVYTFANDVVRDVAFERFVNLPGALVLADQTRTLTFTGGQVRDKYLVKVHPQALQALPVRQFLDLGLQLGVRGHEGALPDADRSYALSLAGAAVSDEISHRTLLQLATNVLDVLDPANLRRLTAARTRCFPAMSGWSRRLIDDACHILPRVMALVERYVQLDPKVVIMAQGGQEYTAIDLRMQLNLDVVRQDYPHLGAYLENVLNGLGLALSAVYRTPRGGTLMTANVDLPRRRLDVAFQTAAGGLLPGERGRVAFAESIVPAALTRTEGVAVIGVDVNFQGLTISAKNIEIEAHYADAPVAVMAAKLKQIPPPQFAGALLGLLPPGLIDWMIPGTLNGYAETLIHGLLTANGTQGTYLKCDVDTTDPGHTLVAAAGSTEIVDNFFLRLGMEIVNTVLWPDVGALSDARGLFGEGLARGSADLAAVTPQRAEARTANVGVIRP